MIDIFDIFDRALERKKKERQIGGYTVEHRQQEQVGMFRWRCSCGSIAIAVHQLRQSQSGWRTHLRQCHGISNARVNRLPCPDCMAITYVVGFMKYKLWIRIGRWCDQCKVLFQLEEE